MCSSIRPVCRRPLRRENFTTSRYRVVVAVLACALVGTMTFPSMAAAGTQTFMYTGAAQSWVVPAGVTSLMVDVYGGQGGYDLNYPARVPGLGGRTQATIPVTPGETLRIHVGGAGTATAGGWNGGGNPNLSGGGGGGASDIRRAGTTLPARVVVAGGGGGTSASLGGSGGGLIGEAGEAGGSTRGGGGGGGTQMAGGAGGAPASTCPCGEGSPGTLGYGGAGTTTGGSSVGAAGGGGGYYGGGGGGSSAQFGGGGGGGSSYASSFASGMAHTQGYKWGHGFVSVAWGGDTPPEAPRPASITLSPKTQTRELSGSAQISARVVDQFSNPMAGVTVHYKVGSWDQFSATNSSGVAYINYGYGNNTPHVDTVTGWPEKYPTVTDTATVVWSDTVPPSRPTVTSGPASFTNSTSATFTFTGEPGGTFQCKLDDDAFSNCTSPKSYTGLSEGSHTFKVHQTDSSGNVSPDTSYTWTVDTTPPAAPTIGTKPENPSNSSNPTFTFTGEEGATFQCKLDGSSFSSCASPKTYSDVADGSHTFTVRQTDRAGNVSMSTATYTWTIDTIAPAAPTITEAPDLSEQSGDARFSFTGEAGASFACRVDDDAYASCSSPKTYDSLADGVHSFAVRQTDAAGNTSPSATHTWVVASGSGTIRPGSPSESCGPGAKKIADGFFGDTYVRLRYERVDSRTTWVCFRAAGDTANLGGRLTVIAGTVAAEPTVDDEAYACDSESDEVPEDAQQSGHFGDEDDGSYTPYLIEPEVSVDGAAFCLAVGGFAKRVILPTTGIAAPDVELDPDSPPVPSPAPADGREGYPSRTCDNGPGGTHMAVMNMAVGDDGHVWLDAWQPGLTQAFACVRLEGPVGIGGVLGVDTTGSPGITAVMQPGTDMGACSLDVFTFDQHGLVIARSAPGGNTQTLCVKQGNTVRTLTVGTSGEPDTDVFTWTPDPGTPLGPIS